MPEPARVVNVSLNYTPRKWQLYCHQHFKRWNVLAVHRRAGKSEMAAMLLIDRAVQCRFELPVFAYIAPQLKQARANLWDRLKSKLKPLFEAGGVEYSESEPSVRFLSNGAKIRLYGADDPDTLRGAWMDGAVFDETAQMKSEVWTEVVSPMLSDLTRPGGWALFIGTPKGINLFSKLYYEATQKADWFAKKFTCYETDSLSAVEIERLKTEVMSPRQFDREMRCDFEALSDDQLLSLADIHEAARRSFNPLDRVVTSAPVVFGVDPARFGDDRSVLVRRQGLVMFEPMVWREIDNMALADAVANQIRLHSPAAVFIDAGAGAGVIDRLRSLRHNVIEVPFGGKALTGGFVNRRTEMWCSMASWIRGGGSIPNDQELITELATPTYWFNNRDEKVLEPKDAIRERMQGKSPDLSDALALTFAAPVSSELSIEDERLTPKQRQAQRYHPFHGARRR